MKVLLKRRRWILLGLLLLPPLAAAWWNGDWGYKKKIGFDMQKMQQEGLTLPDDALALIRLHTGNFTYFADLAEGGRDIRMLGPDEQTPLKFYLDKIDLVNEMALIWVRLPKDLAAAPEPALWLYYGNAEAADGQDAPGSFAVGQVLAYAFGPQGVKDLTANANHPSEATAVMTEGGIIADAAVFNGGQIIRVPASPSLVTAPDAGWTFAAWIKQDQSLPDGVVFQRTGEAGGFTLAVKDFKPVLEVADQAGASQIFTAQTALTPATWQHLAVTVTAETLTLYIDGAQAGSFPARIPALTSPVTIGADAEGKRGLTGALDQLSLFKTARTAGALKFDAKMQGASSALLIYGEDSTPDGEESESYFITTLSNVTVDGWVIIGILAVMFLISAAVIVTKAITLIRVQRGNLAFEHAFKKLGGSDVADEISVAVSLVQSHSLFALITQRELFESSSLYGIYQVGVEEMLKRLPRSVGADAADPSLSAAAMAAVKASMDAVLIRQLQRLNSGMVLLTIAISGGPFLGLLGTVVGVMITFAAIAANGEVNVNAIAPGIAAALAATVAGLAVAIPALFGYNYLGSRIKVITADMQVFVDEFVAKLAEHHT